MSVRIQLRRDTAANWTSTNPTLTQGEPGYETDTGKIKYGDGSTAWNSLAYASGGLPAAFAAGTAAAPGFAVDGDSNTGIYSPGADQLALSTNGTGRLFVDASGNVGLGTNSPQQGLHVHNSGSTSSRIRITNSTTTDAAGKGLQFTQSGVTSFITNNEAGDLAFATSATERMRLDSSGRLGIGTSAPTQLLQLGSFGGSDSSLQLATATTGASNILFGDGASGADYYRGYIAYRHTTDSLEFGANGSERFRCDSSGRLLVGTSSSSASAAAVLQGFAGSPAGQGILNLQVGKNTAATAANENLGSLRFANSDGNIGAWISGEADLQWNSGDYPSRLVFSTTSDNASSPSERLRISNTGAFGLSGANYGSSGQVLTSQGSGAAPQWATPGGGGQVVTTTFTSSGTFTKNADDLFYFVHVVGGGGSGAYQAGPGTGSGGGGGAGFMYSIPASAIGATVTVTVGAGGASQIYVANGGSGGGTSSFGSYTAYGGPGGRQSALYPLTSGILSAGLGNSYSGTPNDGGLTEGGGGTHPSSVFGGGAGCNSNGTYGGTSMLAGAGSPSVGTSPTIPGGGGFGKLNGASGAGARGEVRVYAIRK